ncbi:MAG: cation-translocating P-type ATPase [Litorilinea sp.]
MSSLPGNQSSVNASVFASAEPLIETREFRIGGMDCAECARHVNRALVDVEGVESVQVLLTAEKAIVQLNPAVTAVDMLRQAVARAGYTLSSPDAEPDVHAEHDTAGFGQFSRRVASLLALVFGGVLLIVIAGEWLGLFEQLTQRVPFWLGAILVIISGWPILRNVGRAALNRQITAHTLMTVGMLAALVVGEWTTAAVVVFFMRMGDYAENFTAQSSRRAVKDLMAMAPQVARVERDGHVEELAIGQVVPGDTVIVRPGEKIPIDGIVLAGTATVDQAAITGESMPVEIAIGDQVFAATLARLGSLRIQTERTGADTTFGRVVRMVEEAEAHRAQVQRIADKVSSYYLPVVIAIALLTFAISRDSLATAAVLLVACSCSFALATPIALLASVGAGAKQGLLIKGGKYLESLARADVLLIDKTGTLTWGKPELTDVIALNGGSDMDLLRVAASVERDSEHPLAEAVREAARARGLALGVPEMFVAVPGMGVRAQVDGVQIAVGNSRLIRAAENLPLAAELEQAGKTLLFVARNDELMGILAATDTMRAEVPRALARVRKLGISQIELLTGDNQTTAATLAARLGISYRSQLLPEDKIAVVKEYQAAGHTVVMVGDGVNDAPALAQADIGMAMGAAGTDIALESAHIAIMRNDWTLVPHALHIAQRTMGVVRMNLGFTVVYNLVGLSLAAFGFLPPIAAAAAQSLPDLGILANSARLLRAKPSNAEEF